MPVLKSIAFVGFVSSLLLMISCGGGTSSSPTTPPTPPSSAQLQVQAAGTGTGTISSSPSGISCGKTCIATFQSGTHVTLTATPGQGSTFVGWGGACSGTGACKITVSSNSSVTATFMPVSSTEGTLIVSVSGTGTVSSTPAGISCLPTCSAQYANGTQVTLTATAGANSSFSGWSVPGCGTATSCKVTVNGTTPVTASFAIANELLTVQFTGNGTGTVNSSPAGISCPPTCSATYPQGTVVQLTENPGAGSTFTSWSGGGCSGMSSTCNVTMSSAQSVTAQFNVAQGLNTINHIIFMAQENRSFDSYFGAMRAYWAQAGIPDQSFNGLPQFNPASGIAPLYGPPPSNPGCDPNFPYSPPPAPFQNCVFDTNNPVTSYHLITQCIENPSPFWNEAHVDWDYNDPEGTQTATLDGFVYTAAHDARDLGYYDNNPYNDTDGIRAMGYYDWTDLNYYYFMATDFATSDNWFSPVMSRTEPNREYLIAATSQGYVYPIGSNQYDQKKLTSTTIFQELQNAGISWKIYVDPGEPNSGGCPGPPYQASCLVTLSYINDFQWVQTLLQQYPNNIGTVGPAGTCGTATCDFENDVANGTLPQVVQIEPASDMGRDEHPSDYDQYPINIQLGAQFTSGIINSLMTSSSWSDSAFILTYDEFGGTYDHVSPQQEISPDNIPPVDLETSDICYGEPGTGTCNFTYSGYRVPLIVISPYAKQNYVSHTFYDSTAILTLIEKRFNLPNLNARDKAQSDMSMDFFNFTNPPWMTPPTPPTQLTNGACYLNKLP
jgi:phospholipase C